MRTAAWPAWAVATLAASFTAWLFWPGLMSFDSLYQYRQAIGDVPMSAYHPPLMSWAWRVLDGLFGAGGLLLFYLALYWSAVALLATGLARHWLAACALVLLLGLWPPLWIHSATLWNDSGVVAGLLMAVAGLLRAQGPEARRWLVVSAVALFWALAMKRSALFAVLPLVAWWLLTWWRSSSAGRTATWRRFLYAASAGVLAFMAVSGLNRMAGDPVPKWGTIAAWDLVAVSLVEGELLVPRSALVHDGDDEPQALERLGEHFEPHVNGTLHPVVTLIPDENNSADLWAAWAALPSTHTRAYLAHRGRVFGGLLGLGTVPQNLPYQRHMPPNELGLAHARADHPLTERVFRSLRRVSRTVFYEPWFYALLGALGLARLWRCGDGPWWLYASGLCSMAPLFVLAPATDFRYALWLVASGWLLFLWSFIPRRDPDSS